MDRTWRQHLLSFLPMLLIGVPVTARLVLADIGTVETVCYVVAIVMLFVAVLIEGRLAWRKWRRERWPAAGR